MDMEARAPAGVTCSDLIVSLLADLGLNSVFGVPGGNIDPLCSALADSERRGGPRWILARSESGAAFMADGYYRESGRIGVCAATSGPGGTNLITGLASAYVENIPILAITAQPPLATFGRGAMQDGSDAGLDLDRMLSACTRYSSLVSHPDQLEHKLLTALSHALSATPGPVHLSIPVDILQRPIEALRRNRAAQAFLGQTMVPSSRLLAQLEALLNRSQRGAIVVGPGCRHAMDVLLPYAERRRWPVVTTPAGRGLVSLDHPLFRGVFGTAGHESARLALLPENAETVLVVGADLDEHATCGWDGSTILSPRLVHVDSNPEHLARSHMARLNVWGDPCLVFERLLEATPASPAQPTARIRDGDGLPTQVSLLHRADCLADTRPINPRALFWRLSQWLPTATRLYADAGNSFYWAPHYWHPPHTDAGTGNGFQIAMGYAAMGWAIGAAVGAKFAAPAAPVVCLTGDGSYLMTAQELSVAQQHGLNLIMLVLNDGYLGTVRHGQRLRGFSNNANQLPATDFALMAQALGIESHRIDQLADLERIDWRQLMARPGPVLLDVQVDGEIVPPIGQRIATLQQPG